MEELYWITRLDGISTFLSFILIFSGMAFAGCSMAFLNSSDDDDEEQFKANSIKGIKYSLITMIISATINIFIPTTKEAYVIYGIGGAIDYIKNDSVATQLPHKAIVALDKWLDENKKDGRKND